MHELLSQIRYYDYNVIISVTILQSHLEMLCYINDAV